jgi:hypothetical protein
LEYIDPLKSFSDREFMELAIIERLEDVAWVDGTIISIDGKEKIVNGDTYGRSIDEIANRWKMYFKATIEESTWSNGKHNGDCTKVPATCFRCMCEEKMSELPRPKGLGLPASMILA